MHDDTVCETEILARSRYCTIARCHGCQAFHLHFGAISLRLKEEIFHNICETMARVYLQSAEPASGCGSGVPNH